MLTSEALNAAANDLAVNGWTKGNEGVIVGAGPHCALGAIGYVIGAGEGGRLGDKPIYNADEILFSGPGRALCAQIGDEPDALTAVWSWNDNQSSPEPVIATLRAAAVIEAAKEDGVELTAPVTLVSAK